MKIKNIHIENFGKLKDFSMSFNDGLNVICRENEFGKSTIMAFIELMFYGKQINDRKQDVLVNNRKRYSPWDGSQMAGDIEFEADGVNYNLHKEFKKTANTDIVVLLNKDTGSVVDISKDEEIGNRFLGLDISSFEKSVYINTLGGFGGSGDSSEDLAVRLSNLVSSKDESISGSEVVKRLTEAKEKLVSKNGKNGSLRETQKEIEGKKNSKENLKIELEQYQMAKERADAVYSEMKEVNSKKNSIEKTNESIESEISFFTLKKIKDDILEKDKFASQLLKGRYSENELKSFIQKRQNELKEIELLKKQYQGKSLEIDDDSIFIDDEEYREFRGLTKEIERLEKTADFINYTVLPTKESFEKADGTLKAESGKTASQLKSSVVYPAVAGIAALAGVAMIFVMLPVALVLLVVAAIMAAATVNDNKKVKTVNAQTDKANSERISILSEDRQDKYVAYKSQMDKLMSMYDEARTSDVTIVYDNISHELSGLKKKKNTMLDNFGCNNDEEVDKQYISSRDKVDNRKHMAALEKDITSKEKDFIMNFSEYVKLDDINQADAILRDITDKLHELDNLDTRIDAVIQSSGVEIGELDNEIERLKTGLRDGISCDSQVDTSSYKQILIDNKQEISRLTMLSNSLDQNYRELSIKLRQPDMSMEQLDSELSELAVQEAEQQEYLDTVELAAKIMQESVDEIGREFGPALNDATAGIFSKLTGGEYETVSVEKNYEMRVKKASGTYREWKYLSSGTVDQAYLSLRFAVARLITADSESLPILLDDVFVQYDNNRFAKAMEFLKEYANNTQIVYFTSYRDV